MNAKELAEKLNGREYTCFISQDEIKEAKENGLVVIYGASDDLMEMVGAINDEGSCYNGGHFKIDNKGIICPYDYENFSNFEEMKIYVERCSDSKTIEAIWEGQGEYSWTYKTDIPHECFDLYEDPADNNQKYCRGIVFSVADIEEFKPNLKDALKAAVAAIYFDDNSDYGTALWQVVNHIGGKEAVKLLENDSRKAYEKYCTEENA